MHNIISAFATVLCDVKPCDSLLAVVGVEVRLDRALNGSAKRGVYALDPGCDNLRVAVFSAQELQQFRVVVFALVVDDLVPEDPEVIDVHYPVEQRVDLGIGQARFAPDRDHDEARGLPEGHRERDWT